MASALTRREFVRDAGGLLLGFSLLDASIVPRVFAAGAGADEVPAASRLDSWLRIGRDGEVTVFTGKVDIGMGVETALTQFVADELDVAPQQVTFVMGDTSRTNDQGGVGGSTSISMGSKPLRNVAATARARLVDLASARLGVAPDRLEVRDGVVSVKGESAKHVSYADLVAPGALGDVLKVSGSGFAVNVEGRAKPKDPSAFRVVGQSMPRVDMPPKVLGTFQYVTDVRIPGMLHGRVIRPSAVGAKLVSVDDGAAKQIPGYVRTIVKGDFVGVLAEHEWAAVRAADTVAVKWSGGASFPTHDDLYGYMRGATPKATRETVKKGDAAAAFAAAARRVEARYDFPFQSHATMGPGCAIADVCVGGEATIWSGAQKPHALQKGIAELIGVAADRVRVIWVEDAGSYGRPGFEDAAADAALLSQAAGRPVRVQWMRDDMTAWGTKGPAVACDLEAAIDASGRVAAIRFTSRAFSGGEVLYQPSRGDNFLAAHLAGTANASGVDEFVAWGSQGPNYAFPNVQSISHVIAPLHEGPSPLRSTHLRDPEGPAGSFAIESFVDEIAAAIGVDPLELRLQYVDEPRAKKVLQAAADKAKWRAHRGKAPASGDIATGRGMALGARNGTFVGTVAEVEVNRRTGAVRVTRFVCAHDCGLIVNPASLKRTIQANLIQSMSRALKEEVTFDGRTVTSVDWRTYPVARASEIPQIDVVLLDHPELPPGGAGEPSSRATAAAIANAVFDAIGARVRRAPLTAARVKAAM